MVFSLNLLSAYGLASCLNDLRLIMIQRLEASSQPEWRDFEKHDLLDVTPLKLPRHVYSVGPAYCILAHQPCLNATLYTREGPGAYQAWVRVSSYL